MASKTFAPKNPTVRKFDPFYPGSDAEDLKKAMKGIGTNEAALIRVLANRSNDQRQAIAQEYRQRFGKDLVKDLKSETSGAFMKLLVAIMSPVPEFYAKELKAATAGLGTNESAIIEIICSLSKQELDLVKAIYEAQNKNSLKDDLKNDTSGHFQTLLKTLCSGKRDEAEEVSKERAKQDAQVLHQAGENVSGTFEEVFITLLARRSYSHLKAVLQEYEILYGHPFEKAIKKEFSGDIRDAFLTILKRTKGKPMFFAELLKDSMAGLGTKEKVLIRIIAPRSEIDLRDIQIAYQVLVGKTLEESIKDETSGDFKKLLLDLQTVNF